MAIPAIATATNMIESIITIIIKITKRYIERFWEAGLRTINVKMIVAINR
jgi:hypothetical protein